MRIWGWFWILAIACAAVALAQPKRVALVLDGSGSMWGRVEGREKIVVAREVLDEVLAELPPELEIGLAAYGHRRERDCSDIELLLPVGPHPRKVIREAIARVQPRGMTPITAALQRTVDELGRMAPGGHVVLVSDGKETCEGDPCALVRSFRQQGVEVTFHVVGFDVPENDRRQLECIATEGGGVYAEAATAEELTAALGQISETVVEEAPREEEEYVDLETGWRVHQYETEGSRQRDEASYKFSQQGRVAVQTSNPMPSVYYRIEPLPEGVEVTGSFEVRTSGDDDFVGFVFGWQDPGHYYLFDWKQRSQKTGRCGRAHEGATLKLVATDEAPPAERDVVHCRDFWSSKGTERVRVLVSAGDDAIGWKDETRYDFRLVYRPGDIRLEVREGDETVVSITSDDATYPSGSFGFYNYSQPSVRYDSFRFTPLD